ncbi:MAG: replication restart helicase PriA [Candidatus Methylomirabilales bacterium]
MMAPADRPAYAEVALPTAIDKTLTYAVPPHLREAAAPGKRVLVPLGPRVVSGYLVRLRERVEITRLKEIQDILDPEPLLDEPLLELTRRVADYYGAPWGTVIKAALPPGIDASTRRLVRLTEEGHQALAQGTHDLGTREEELLRLLAPDIAVPVSRLTRQLGKMTPSLLQRLRAKRLLSVETSHFPARVRERHERSVRLIRSEKEVEAAIALLKTRAPRQAELLSHLLRAGGTLPAREMRTIAGSPSVVFALMDRGLIEPLLSAVSRDPFRDLPVTHTDPLPLSSPQREAFRQIEEAATAERYVPFLLFGVTGSGKTEIYLQAIDGVMKRGRQALVLVPEIALTPRTTERFRARFGDRVALLHSALTPGERLDEWLRIRRGEADIVVGVRSAVFAPLPRLGIVVVDEEHDPAYKQEDSLRYHGRDVALIRGELTSCPVVLGSATPSLESFHRAQLGQYRLASLPERIGAGLLPKVTVVDLRRQPKEPGQRLILSRILEAGIREGLDRREQVLLLLNRRGYATSILCRDCGYLLRCPSCHVSLTLHRGAGVVRCHHCEYQRRPPDCCPDCRGSNLRQLGLGTEQVERELQTLFPHARIARMDRDTTAGRQGHHLVLQRLERGDLDILVGTQMIAKGHDYPNVTVVGVLSADIGLNLPDFRAGERTFALLTQMVGRSGRGSRRGDAVIQTYNPDHYCIQAALHQDFLSFAREELVRRQERNLPPFTRLIRLLISSPQEKRAAETAEQLGTLLRQDPMALEIDGPAPAPLSRLRGRFRWHLFVKGSPEAPLRSKVAHALEAFTVPRGGSIHLEIDVDPVDTL